MDKFYFIGGWNDDLEQTSAECFALNTEEYEWTSKDEVARMKSPRSNLACEAFQGRIVVCGGFDNVNITNSVETYDHGSNSWTPMASMIERRYNHSLISMRNKMFVVGGKTSKCEVYDTISDKFILLKLPPKSLEFDFNNTRKTFTIGGKLFIVGKSSKTLAFYDVDKKKWSEEQFENKKRFHFCLKVPQS